MKIKDLKINFRYLGGNIACLSVDSIDGEAVHNDINNEEAIIIFNSLVGEKENCQTVKTLLKENQQLKKQLENCYCNRTDCSGRIKDSKVYDSLVQKVETQQQEFIKWLEDEIKLQEEINDKLLATGFEEVLQKYKEIIGVSDEKEN